MSETLKPCPFCGEAEALSVDFSTATQRWTVWCSQCDSGTFNSADRDKSIAAWNRRAGSSNPPAGLYRCIGGKVERVEVEAIQSCKGEQYAFEDWAKAGRFDMTEHPLHYLFLDERTGAARRAWKAALAYAARVLGVEP